MKDFFGKLCFKSVNVGGIYYELNGFVLYLKRVEVKFAGTLLGT